MKVLFMGQFYEKNEQAYLKKICKNGVSAAHYKFQSNLIAALQSGGCEVSKLTSLPVGNFPNKSNKLFFRTRKNNSDISIGYINLPIVKHWIRYYKAKKYIRIWDNLTRKDISRAIIIYDCYLPFLKACVNSKLKNCKIILVIPDLPGKYCIEYKGYDSLTKRYKNSEYEKLVVLVKKIDGAVVLTEAMASILNIDNYMVMEAICDTCLSGKKIENEKTQVLYAGELTKSVGIIELLEAFKLLQSRNDVELLICGNGEMERDVKEAEKSMGNVRYLGFLLHKQMQEILQSVDICINPRKGYDEYTKYSFPSKNIEYLKTGKPVVAYKLPGIPDEYDEYLIYPSDDTCEKLKDAILYAAQIKDSEERKKSQLDFIKENKCIEAQGKHLVSFIKSLK